MNDLITSRLLATSAAYCAAVHAARDRQEIDYAVAYAAMLAARVEADARFQQALDDAARADERAAERARLAS